MSPFALRRCLLSPFSAVALLLCRGGGAEAVGPPPGNAAVLASTSESRRTAAETVSFAPTLVDLGRYPWYSRAPFVSTLKNDSRDGVRISAVTVSCGCVGVDRGVLQGKELLPGESVEVAGFLENNGNIGVLEQRIDVLFENGSIRTLTIVENSYPTYTISPQKLDFDEVEVADPDTEPSGTLTFQSDYARLLGAESDSPWLDVGVIDGSPARVIARLVLDSLPQGRNTGHIILNTDDPARPKYSVTCNVSAMQELRPIPGQVFLTKTARSASVRFVRQSGEMARVQEIVVVGGGIAARIADDHLSVIVEGLESAADRGGILRITDDQGKHSRVLVSDSKPLE